MGIWLVDSDVLARSRFAVSALTETVGALLVLLGGRPAPGQFADVAGARADFRKLIAADPVAAGFARAAKAPGWIADFLTTPSTGEFATEVGRLRRTPQEVLLADLAYCLGGEEPAELRVPDLGDRIADIMTWIWNRTVRPDWPRRARILEADIVARTRALSTGGWAAALDGLRHDLRWLGEGRLQINAHAYPPRDLTGAHLLFIPSTTAQGWAGFGPPHRYSLIYPCSGVLVPTNPRPPDALSRLLGPGRAAILTHLTTPLSTTHLVAVTGLPLGAVGNHLRVLLDAGLLHRRRSGRSVLYYQTPTGQAVAAGITQ
ncbi:winged helix-turn-helix domain-containing protein [Winogradskya consettensis]|uniref:Transcriptional regulator n=1 Tax=Winogradskya consettensis TaxID=113560 RepID=A0A919S9N6_9ACTN|nr:winged helix-turn-helix domain-containing protein [Actinoplanes consettensis]GIM66889.1 transcriptional regulator [Actinoplanes consettensis]